MVFKQVCILLIIKISKIFYKYLIFSMDKNGLSFFIYVLLRRNLFANKMAMMSMELN